MSKKIVPKPKMTLEKLARMTANEFGTVRKEMADEFKAVRTEMADEFKAVKTEMRTEFVEVRKEMQDMKKEILIGMIQSNDKVITKLDVYFKDQAAHDALHKRIENTLHDHGKRIKTLEGVQ